MKSVFSKLFLASAFALTVRANAATITQTATGVDLGSTLLTEAPVSYSGFSKFNSNSGTLNSVTFYIDSVDISGSFVFTQTGGTNNITKSTVTGFTADVVLYPGVSGAGYNGLSTPVGGFYSSQVVSVSTDNTPVNIFKTNPTTTAYFKIDNGQSVVSSPISYDVTSGNFTGSGNAPAFDLLLQASFEGIFRGQQDFIYSSVQSLGNLRLVYDYTAYTPVPEPSTYGIGLGVLALAAVAVRRRKVKA